MFTNDRGEAIHLNWTIEESRIRPVDNYTLFWRIEREGDDEEGSRRRQNNENNIRTTDKSYNLTDYITEAVYIFWVVAENNAGRSQISNERRFDVDDELQVLGTERKRSGLDVWVIALIGSIILLCIICICCILCCICLFCCLAARRKRTYYAEEQGTLIFKQNYKINEKINMTKEYSWINIHAFILLSLISYLHKQN